MSGTCNKCWKRISRQDDSYVCSNKECGRIFHLECVDSNEKEYTDLNLSNQLKYWLCVNCRDNDMKKCSSVEDVSSGVKSKSDMDEIKAGIASLNGNYSSLLQKVDLIVGLVERVQDLEIKVADLTAKDAKNQAIIESLREKMELQYGKIMNKCNDLEYNTKKKNLIIYGVPAKENENTYQVFDKIANAAQCEVHGADIVAIHRLPPRRRRSMDQSDGQTVAPPIIVAFRNTDAKKHFVKKAKSSRLTTAKIGYAGSSRPVYFNDQLTELNAVLFRKARAFKLSGEYQFVWTEMGRVLMKKDKDSPIISIRSESDLPN